MAKGTDKSPLATLFESQTVFYSGPQLKTGAASLGKRHYSYRFALDKFIAGLDAAGAKCVELPLPEFFGNEGALPKDIRENISSQSTVPHLIFRSTEEIRLLKFAYNIACFAWEFDVLDNYYQMDSNILDNQVHMLSICDEVWAPCAFTKRILNDYGLERVEILPAPIEIPLLDSDAERRSRGDWLNELAGITAVPMNHNTHWHLENNLAENQGAAKSLFSWIQECPTIPEIFISVLNPEDFRKNLDAMLRGFHKFTNINKNSILIIKLAISLQGRDIDYKDLVYKIIRPKLSGNGIIQSSKILFISDYLSDEMIDAFYRAADFYLCTSIAEGQNLPLLEAMGRGVVPVSTRHTAMADYLDDRNSIEVASRRVENFIPHLAPSTFARRFEIDHSDDNDVFAALMAASATSAQKRKELSEAAIATVRRLYSPEALVPKIVSRLQAIQGKTKNDGES